MKPCATSRVRRTHPRPILGGKNARAWMCAFRIACINRFDRFARSARSNSKDSFAGSINQPSWSEKNRLISRLILNGPFIVAREEIEGGSNWNAMGGVIKEEILACVEIGIWGYRDIPRGFPWTVSNLGSMNIIYRSFLFYEQKRIFVSILLPSFKIMINVKLLLKNILKIY